MNRNNKQVKQECSCCGRRFDLMYWAKGTYTYLDDPCDCQAEFHPVEGSPTLSEWLAQIELDEQRERLSRLLCAATQKTNYKCKQECELGGRCAYTLTLADHLLNNGVRVERQTK